MIILGTRPDNGSPTPSDLPILIPVRAAHVSGLGSGFRVRRPVGAFRCRRGDFHLVALVDDRLRLDTHAPTVWVLICGGRNDQTVRYVLGLAGSPMAVATYTYDSLPPSEKNAFPAAVQLLAAFDDRAHKRRSDGSAVGDEK